MITPLCFQLPDVCFTVATSLSSAAPRERIAKPSPSRLSFFVELLLLFFCSGMQRFDLFSFKKILEPAFFESTLPGAWLTIVGGIIMLLLGVAEFSSFLTVTVVSGAQACLWTRVG